MAMANVGAQLAAPVPGTMHTRYIALPYGWADLLKVFPIPFRVVMLDEEDENDPLRRIKPGYEGL